MQAHGIIVLGPIGAGKSYVIRRLTEYIDAETIDVFPILLELFGNRPEVKKKTPGKVYYFTDEMLETGYAELVRRVEKVVKTCTVICEVATDSLYERATQRLIDLFKRSDMPVVLVYVEANKDLCLQRNNCRMNRVPDARQQLFFQHELGDIQKLAQTNEVSLRVISTNKIPEISILSLAQSLQASAATI